MGILDPPSRELRVEQEEEEGEGEVSLLVESDGMLVLRGRPDDFRRPRLGSLSTGETDLEKRWFSFLLLLGGDLGPVLLQLTRHRYQSCVATMVNNTIVNLLLNANQISLFHERLKT